MTVITVAVPVLPIISSIGLLSNIEVLFLQLSVWDDDLLPTTKTTTLLTNSLPKVHETAASNTIS